jgi:hypothetical protein
MSELGDWRWYFGSDDDDDEMCEVRTRDAAITDGLRDYAPGDAFYVVEGRMKIADEDAMAAGEMDSAPFAETRGGFWVTVSSDRTASYKAVDE